MITIQYVHQGKTSSGGLELVKQWQDTVDSWIWIDLFDEDHDAEQQLLCEQLNLDEHMVVEAQRPRHPPHFESFPDYRYLLLKPLTVDSDSLDFETLQLAIFVSARLLVTRHSRQSRYLSQLQQQLQNEVDDTSNPYNIATSICEHVTKRYGKILLDLEHRLDEVEDQLFDSRTDSLMQELLGYNTALRKMRRIISYHTSIFKQMRDDFNKKSEHDLYDEMEDIYNVMERFSSLAELYQNVLSDLVDGYISLNAHNLNQIMKVLTIVTVIFVPLTLLVGIYGMNFENIPELKSPYGYYILLGVMSFIIVALLWLFRRLKWL